jgi:hypothetical protein
MTSMAVDLDGRGASAKTRRTREGDISRAFQSIAYCLLGATGECSARCEAKLKVGALRSSVRVQALQYGCAGRVAASQ